MIARTTNQIQKWQLVTRNMLRAGYGVEDIARELTMSADTIRGEVARLRRSGELLEVLGL